MKFIPKHHNNMEQKREIIRNYIKNNPECTYSDIKKDTKIKIERVYKSMKDAYNDACVELSKNLTKRGIIKQKEDVITFIKSYPKCSVIDIHTKIKVNIIRVFGGIKNAYKEAGVEYQEKEVTSGVRNPDIIRRANEFEKHIIKSLEKFGDVKSKVITYAGIADSLLSYNGENIVIEVKDFRGRNNVTMHEIKQLLKYLKALNLKKGILICPK